MIIVPLAEHRKPVLYTVSITHEWDGTIRAVIHDVNMDEPANQRKVGEGLMRIAKRLLGETDAENQTKGD